MEGFFSRWGFCILIFIALCYYGSYYRAGLYPAAEGGVEGMISLRLLEGWRPMVDTFLGYNVLWFYPIAGVFKVLGPDYTALRIYFLILCTLTGLISFRLVLKSSGCGRLAFLAGLLVLMIPGQMYRNYMALIVVLNMTTFLSAYVLRARNTLSGLLWMAASGVTLAVAWLIRVDVGFFLTCIAIILVLIYPFSGDHDDNFLRRSGLGLTGLLLAAACFCLIHLPFYKDAVRRGFGPEFVGQYQQWPSMIDYQGKRILWDAVAGFREVITLVRKPAVAQPVSTKSPIAMSGEPPAQSPNLPIDPVTLVGQDKQFHSAPPPTAISQMTLARRSLLADSARDRMTAFNLYLPILVAGVLALGAVFGWMIGLSCRIPEATERSLILLTSLGCSFALFPQYFFWRPDMVHLSEFMVPMTITILLGCHVSTSVWKFSNSLTRLFLSLVLFTSLLTLALYYINAFQSQSSGGIAVSQHKILDFHGANGVHVKLSPTEYEDARSIYKIITSASRTGEYVICYPYNPEINFMTDRPSYEYNFYVDNAMVPPDQFYKETVQKINAYRPVVFVITDWEINNTEESKFKNWASQTYNFIAKNYKLAYRRGNVEVFVRPDRFEMISK